MREITFSGAAEAMQRKYQITSQVRGNSFTRSAALISAPARLSTFNMATLPVAPSLRHRRRQEVYSSVLKKSRALQARQNLSWGDGGTLSERWSLESHGK